MENSFKGSIAELSKEDQYIEKRRLELMSRQVSKINIQTVIAWVRDMGQKASKQNGKEIFVSRCNQVVSDMVQVSEEYKVMERELEVSRQRNMDLERSVILYKIESEQKQKIIENMQKELESKF